MSKTNRAIASSDRFKSDQLDPREYQALETALLQTGRGRDFLDEYLRRNGGVAIPGEALSNEGHVDQGLAGGDTDRILQAVEKLHDAVMTREVQQMNDPVRMDILEMAKAIAKTRAEISAMRTDGEDDHLSVASGEMDAIVQSTEKATNDILQAAEKIQEVAWRLRENGIDEAACEEIDNNATEIYMACSFQDLTGQRTTKVVRVLQYLEARITSMVDIWGLGDEEQGPDLPGGHDLPAGHDFPAGEALVDNRPDAHLLNGPQKDDKALAQESIDALLGEDCFDPIEPEAPIELTDSDIVENEPMSAKEQVPPAPPIAEKSAEDRAEPLAKNTQPAAVSGASELIDEEQLKALFS
ncbi:MAG: protein phosphatase CheZ [Hyphomicrobiaceae bacterium]|nr:protein phosphatase CheZ [Hyphomicrobiaceae bacterium]